MMNLMHAFHRFGRMKRPIALCLLAFGLLFLSDAAGAQERNVAVLRQRIEPLKPGEILTYEVSWSTIVTAGIATMEIKAGTLPDGEPALRFIATTRSTGIVDTFYRVNDKLESIYDPRTMQSLKFSLSARHGKKNRSRELIFDPISKTVVSRLNEDPPETLATLDRTQDALSSLYYLRTRDDLIVGTPIFLHVHDSGKNWSVEVQTLGREQVTTPAGKFSAIKVRTFPKYEGAFMNKGEIFIWFTDDSRRIPVLMKSTISIGSIVSTLIKVEPGMK
ncbi:MAG: DUF3108 domain-containing protein [Nitrospirota bacterium]